MVWLKVPSDPIEPNPAAYVPFTGVVSMKNCGPKVEGPEFPPSVHPPKSCVSKLPLVISCPDGGGGGAAVVILLLQAAENLVKPGDTVEVMNGTYTGPGGGNVLTISTSGTASAPITFEAAPGATPVIDSSGTWQGIELDASYITIKGLTIVGDAANFNLSSAMAGYSTGNPDLNGNGIAATSGKLVHHY